MVSSDQARNSLESLEMSYPLGCSSLQCQHFVRYGRKKAVEDFSPVPYVVTLLNCMLWVFYGIPSVHPNNLLVVIINGTRMLLESIYITIFFLFSPHKLRMRLFKFLAAELLFMEIVIAVVLTAAHTHDKRSIIVGALCVVIGTCMYASPLSVMTKSVKYMPFYLSLAAFLNGVCWIAYALIRFDIFITTKWAGSIAGFGSANFVLLLLFDSLWRGAEA